MITDFDATPFGAAPQITDNGYIVWTGCDRGMMEDNICYTDYEIFFAVPCSIDDDNDDDGYVSASCGGDDCNDSNGNIYPTNSNTYCDCEEPTPQGVGGEIWGDGIDNDCDGLVDNSFGPYVAFVEASTYDASPVIATSDLGKHLLYFLLSIGVMIGLIILRRMK